MKLIDKVRNFKVNSITMIIILVLMVVGVIGYGINYCFYSPSPINRYIASNLYKQPSNNYFEDDNFYQCVVDAYNRENNTSLSYTTNLTDDQLNNIEVLSCNNRFELNNNNKVSSIVGIERLVNLEVLSLDSNLLKEVNLSSNPTLKKVSLTDNLLIKLDLTDNTELEEIYLGGGNTLTELDVSKNHNLKILDFSTYSNVEIFTTNSINHMTQHRSNNQLTSLDVSNNTALEELGISHSQLTNLDISGATLLKKLDVASNQLTSLDVSQNIALEELDVSNNKLTILDVSKNIALKKLDVGYYSSGGSKLERLDVRQNIALEYLHVGFCGLTSLDVRGLESLKILYAYANQLTSLDVSQNTALIELNVGGNDLTSLNVNGLESLTKLEVYNNQLTSLDVSQNTALIELNVRGNDLTSLDVKKNTALKELVAYNNQLTSLDLNGLESLTKLEVYNNQLISLDVGENTALKELSAYNNQLTSLDLNGLESLTKLEVYKNQLISLDVGENTSLKELSAHSNQLTSLDVINNTALTYLNAGSNQLTSFDVSGSESLIYLYAGGNQLTSFDVSQNIALEELDVSNNKLTILDVSGSESLTYLYAGGNQLTSLDVSKNRTLSTLDVYNNQLTSLDVSNNTLLTLLNVSNNALISLNVSGATALKELYANYNQLTSLDVSNNTALTKLNIFNNPFGGNLNPILVGDELNIDDFENFIKIPEQLVSINLHAKVSEGLELKDNKIIATKVGKQSYVVTNKISGSYDETYIIEVVDIKSDKYDIDKAKDYIIVGGDNDDLILENIIIENGSAIIKNGYLIIKNNEYEVKRFKLNRIDSSMYDFSIDKDYIYVGNDNDEEIINNIATIADNISITNNVLNITYGTDYKISYKLVRLNSAKAQYKIGDGYIYVINDNDETILSKIELLNGNDIIENSVSIEGENLIVKYNDVVLDNLKIVRTIINKYNVNEMSNFIYLREDDYNDLRENVIVDNGTFIVDEETGCLKIMFNDNQLHSYEILKLNILNDSYILTDKYLYVGSDSYEDVLKNVKFIRSGQEYNSGINIEYGYLKVSAGVMNKFENLKIIRTSSSVYDLSKDYIYVGTDTNEEIINNIEATANISINDNVLSITYGDAYNVSYKLIRFNTKYDTSNDYIYTFDKNYIDNINIINGSKEVIDGNLVIKYNNIELDRIPILYIYSDDYIIKENYIYTGLSNIDLNKINKSNDLELSINYNKVILKYKDNVISEIPYYYLISNSNNVRFSTVNNKIYVKNTMMTYNQLLQYILFNTGGQSLILFDKNGNRITDGNLLLEEGSYITLYGNTTIKHIIEVNTEYVEYKGDANVYYTTEYGVDIIKNLNNNNNTFINVRDLIKTDGELSILDKDDNLLEETSNIKTGDKFVVSFPSANKYFIYLSVKGDVTGKGNISNDDVLESYSILRGKDVEDYYRLASDINNDGKVRINDVAKLYQYVNNKIESLED